jgi:FkbM family methyltransferase
MFSIGGFFPNLTIRICDIGASPVEGEFEPYKPLLDLGNATVIGFEPSVQECKKFNETNRWGEHAKCLPTALGDGSEATLHQFFAPGMASLLRPNRELLSHFVGFDEWLEPRGEIRVKTSRLDDLDIGKIDYLKLDAQGSELTILQNGPKVLSDVLIVQTEVEFMPMYVGQPLFGDIDAFLRGAGFVLHIIGIKNFRFTALPDTLSRHATEADAVYVRDFTRWDAMPADDLRKMALILNDVYHSYAIVALALQHLDKKINTKFYQRYTELHQRYTDLLKRGAK